MKPQSILNQSIIKLLVALALASLCCVQAAARGHLRINAIRADFIQSITDVDGLRRVSSGYIVARRPQSIKWVYLTPHKKYIYINSDTTTIYSPRLSQAIVQKTYNLNILNILTKASNKNGFKRTYNGITYNLIMKNRLPYILHYKDKLDNKISLTFSNVRINKEVEDHTFSFTPSGDVEVLSE